MKVEILLEDYLTEEEIKEEARFAVRQVMVEEIKKRYTTSVDLQKYFVDNVAYLEICKEIDEVMDVDLKKMIRDKTIETLNKSDEYFEYKIFRTFTNYQNGEEKVDGVAYEILEKAVKDNEKIIQDKVNKAFEDYEFDDFEQMVWEAVTNYVVKKIKEE